MCPVCKKETRHYTKDTHESPVSKMRRIWREIAGWFRCSLSKQTANGNSLRRVEDLNMSESMNYYDEFHESRSIKKR